MLESYSLSDKAGERESLDEVFGSVRAIIARLTRSPLLEQGDLQGGLAQVTESAVLALRVERTSVWQFSEDHTELVCLDLYERTPHHHTKAPTLYARDTPRYFHALSEDRTVAAHDARADLRTREFTGGYLERHGIGAMLDAPILLEGKLVGVVCHEHVGGVRTWKPWEELIAGTLSDFVAMMLGAAERARQARALEAYRARLAQQQRAEEALRQSRKTLRTLFDAAPIPLVLTGLGDAVIRACNQRAAHMFETTVEHTVGRRAPDFYLDPSERRLFLERLTRDGRVDGFVTQLKTLRGRPFWALLNAKALTVEGEPMFMVGFADLSEQKNIESQLRELATTDALTGALNRRRLLELADEEVARATYGQKPLSLAMLDLDHFKAVNDRFGHTTGDEALRLVTQAVRSALRHQDHVSRYGGEEFAVLLPGATLESAQQVVERVRRAVADVALAHGGSAVPLSVSAGVASHRMGESFGELLQRADAALYQAKARGRNRVVVHK